jgi:DNA-directed RNA polymerase subunit H (RpoH/RPB5)
MLTGNEHYVIVKFVSGEQVMAVLEAETADQIKILNPMLIRLFPVMEGNNGKEHVTATPYSKFSDDQSLVIDKSKILFIKNLHHILIPHFNRIVEENSREVLATQGNKAEDLQWEDDQEGVNEELSELTMEEVKKRLDMLKSIIDENKNFVDGNDTIH